MYVAQAYCTSTSILQKHTAQAKVAKKQPADYYNLLAHTHGYRGMLQSKPLPESETQQHMYEQLPQLPPYNGLHMHIGWKRNPSDMMIMHIGCQDMQQMQFVQMTRNPTSVIRKNLPLALEPRSKKKRLWPARTIWPPVSVSVMVGGEGPGPTTVRLPATAACRATAHCWCTT